MFLLILVYKKEGSKEAECVYKHDMWREEQNYIFDQ